MFSITKQVGAVVAGEAQSSVSSLNLALIAQARMCATVVEASDAARLPVKSVQQILESLTVGMRDLAASRAGLVDAVNQLSIIQGQSDLRETDFGCPTGPHKPGSVFRELGIATLQPANG